jgi:hypothetical protein
MLAAGCAHSGSSVQGADGSNDATAADGPADTAPGTAVSNDGSASSTMTTAPTPGASDPSPGVAPTTPAVPRPPSDTSTDQQIADESLLALGDLQADGWRDAGDSSDQNFTAELLDEPRCRALASSSSTLPGATGTGSVSFSKGATDELVLANEVELFANDTTPNALRKLFTSPQLQTCIGASMSWGDSGVDDLSSTFSMAPFDVGRSAGDLGVDWVVGVSFTSAFSSGGLAISMDFRVVLAGIGRAVTLVAAGSVGSIGTPADASSVNITSATELAVKRFRDALARS